MTLPLWIILVHYLADWELQTDRMALNKSKDWWALADHVSVYAAAMTLAYGISQAVYVRVDPMRVITATMAFGGITWVTHFLTDAITSRVNAHWWFMQPEPGIWEQAYCHYPKHDRRIVNPWTVIAGRRHRFFCLIGFDQVVHYVTLALTLKVLA